MQGASPKPGSPGVGSSSSHAAAGPDAVGADPPEPGPGTYSSSPAPSPPSSPSSSPPSHLERTERVGSRSQSAEGTPPGPEGAATVEERFRELWGDAPHPPEPLRWPIRPETTKEPQVRADLKDRVSLLLELAALRRQIGMVAESIMHTWVKRHRKRYCEARARARQTGDTNAVYRAEEFGIELSFSSDDNNSDSNSGSDSSRNSPGTAVPSPRPDGDPSEAGPPTGSPRPPPTARQRRPQQPQATPPAARHRPSPQIQAPKHRRTTDTSAKAGPGAIPKYCIPIRADVRSFDWAALARLTKFDVITIDPPWNLAGPAPSRGVAISYHRLGDPVISSLPIPALQDKGYLLLWYINSRQDVAMALMDHWGYTVVNVIVWVKHTVNRRLAKGHGYYLQHAKEMCLVARKGPPPDAPTPGSSHTPGPMHNVIFSMRRGQSQKPEEIYELCETLVPNGRYLEIFARRNNLRDHWVSVGLEL